MNQLVDPFHNTAIDIHEVGQQLRILVKKD